MPDLLLPTNCSSISAITTTSLRPHPSHLHRNSARSLLTQAQTNDQPESGTKTTRLNFFPSYTTLQAELDSYGDLPNISLVKTMTDG